MSWHEHGFWHRSPVGGAPLLLLAALMLSGTALAIAPARQAAGSLVFWVLAGGHCATYDAAAPAWEARHPDESVSVQLVHLSAVTQRLRSAFWTGGNVPDLVEVEITLAGSFFRGPIDQIGFLDLKPWLERDGLLSRIPASRLGPYSDRGRIYGIPHDIHPVLLAYRADLLEPLLAERGMTVADLDTWDRFWAFGAAITKRGERYLMQLDDVGASSLEALMYQRGADFFNAQGELTITDPRVLDALCRMVPLVAGDHPGRCAINPGRAMYQALEDGYALAVICPDWRSRVLEDNAVAVGGKMKLMPLPAWTPGGVRTSCWGGTMLGITKAGRDPALCWDLAKHLYFPDAVEAGVRYRSSNILPPDRSVWSDPAFHQPRPYWSGQAIGSLYIEQADQTPTTHGHPFLGFAKARLNEVVAGCCAYYASICQQPDAEALLRAHAASRLADAAALILQQLAREPRWPEPAGQ